MPFSYTGEIAQVNEVDNYSVHLTIDQTYHFNLSGHTNGMNGTFDPTLTIYDGAGNQVAFDDDSGPGLDAKIDFTPTYSDDYTFAVAGYSGTGDYTLTGEYTLTNWLVAPDVI
jgi:serralysin